MEIIPPVCRTRGSTNLLAYPTYSATDGTQPSHTIWVGALPTGTSEHDLRQLFGRFGNIENVKTLAEKNCAFIRFSEIREALDAHAHMAGQFIGGQQIKLGWGKPDDAKDELGPPPCKNLWLGNISKHKKNSLTISLRSKHFRI